ncbi:MAG: patatin-like phospholipase family protein [Chlorobiales bacterium]|nr:patatin-like phospholipase family protein [Chlorobiales bacterium]
MKKTGLALGGGAVLGAAHIGVLKALTELDIPISMVSGTSIGAFIAALYAFGKSWQEIRDIAFSLDWFDLSGLVLSQFGLLSNKKFGRIVTEVLGHKNIEDASVPLSIVATDIGTGKKVVFTKGDVALAVMASSCIPGIFRPVEHSGLLFVDGMLMENVPVSPLVESGAESVICVDLLACHIFQKPENIIGLLLNAFYSAITNTTAIQVESVDLCICPDLTGFNLIDVGQVGDLLDAGYRSALPSLKLWAEREQ